jgi:hypothetical protein
MYKAEMCKAGMYTEMYKTETLKSGKLTACLFVLLAIQSTAVQAEVDTAPGQKPETVVETGSDKQAAATQRSVDMHGKSHHWPDYQPINKDLTPPPPPGPYMSTALSDHTVKRRPFGQRKNKPVRGSVPSAMPMDMYSPDRPWPDNLRPPKHWAPENGNHYVSPAVRNKPSPAAAHPAAAHNMSPNRPPGDGYGYRSAPVMNPPGNWPTMNTSGSRWMPSMGTTGSRDSYPVAPYQAQPDSYQSRGNQSRGYQSRIYQSGGSQSSLPGYKQPVNRAPYPTQGRP